MRELLSGPKSGYKPAPKTPQFCCGCFLREWTSHPWYILVELRVSPSILELPKRPLRCPSQLSPPFRTVLRQSAKFPPFIPVRLASRFVRRVAPFVAPFAVRLAPFAVRLAPFVFRRTLNCRTPDSLCPDHSPGKLRNASRQTPRRTPVGVARAGPLS